MFHKRYICIKKRRPQRNQGRRNSQGGVGCAKAGSHDRCLAQKPISAKCGGQNAAQRIYGQPPNDHHPFNNPVRMFAQKPNATGSYANAANLERYMPQSGGLT
jgi:hypothetical protein